jgi:hypothetical protein
MELPRSRGGMEAGWSPSKSHLRHTLLHTRSDDYGRANNFEPTRVRAWYPKRPTRKRPTRQTIEGSRPTLVAIWSAADTTNNREFRRQGNHSICWTEDRVKALITMSPPLKRVRNSRSYSECLSSHWCWALAHYRVVFDCFLWLSFNLVYWHVKSFLLCRNF